MAANAEDASSAIVTEALSRIKKMDEDYDKLTDLNSILVAELEKLKTDETSLRAALAQSTETGREKLARKRKRNEDAIKNLEMALLADDDDDYSNSNDSYSEKLADQHESDIPIGTTLFNASSDEEEMNQERMVPVHQR